MKRPLFFFAFMLATIATHATGQEGDIICIDGTKWELLGKPIYADSSLAKNLEAALPKGRGTVTSNWAGYTALLEHRTREAVSGQYQICSLQQSDEKGQSGMSVPRHPASCVPKIR